MCQTRFSLLQTRAGVRSVSMESTYYTIYKESNSITLRDVEDKLFFSGKKKKTKKKKTKKKKKETSLVSDGIIAAYNGSFSLVFRRNMSRRGQGWGCEHLRSNAEESCSGAFTKNVQEGLKFMKAAPDQTDFSILKTSPTLKALIYNKDDSAQFD